MEHMYERLARTCVPKLGADWCVGDVAAHSGLVEGCWLWWIL